MIWNNVCTISCETTSIFLNQRRERVIITFTLRRPFFPHIFDWHPNVFCKEVKPNLWDEGTSSWGFHHFQISKETLLSTCLICRSRKWRFSLSSSPLVLLSAKLTTTMTLILLICHSGILGILESVEKNLELTGFWFESGSMRKHYRLSSNFPQLD